MIPISQGKLVVARGHIVITCGALLSILETMHSAAIWEMIHACQESVGITSVPTFEGARACHGVRVGCGVMSNINYTG